MSHSYRVTIIHNIPIDCSSTSLFWSGNIVLSKHPDNGKDIMIWVAFCLAYFGHLRVCDFTTSSPDLFESYTDLLFRCSFRQLCIPYNHANYSKAIWEWPVQDRDNNAVCPVDTLVQYLAIRGGTPGPLFLLPNNQSPMGASFRSVPNKAFQELHMDNRQFNTHSFQGCAHTGRQWSALATTRIK